MFYQLRRLGNARSAIYSASPSQPHQLGDNELPAYSYLLVFGVRQAVFVRCEWT